MVGSINPEFLYSKQFTMKCVSRSFLEYLETNALIVELWGTQGSGRAFHSSTLPAATATDESVMDNVLGLFCFVLFCSALFCFACGLRMQKIENLLFICCCC